MIAISACFVQVNLLLLHCGYHCAQAYVSCSRTVGKSDEGISSFMPIVSKVLYAKDVDDMRFKHTLTHAFPDQA